MVALNRVQKQISAMIGAVISEASLLKFLWRLNQSLEQWEAQAIESILQVPSIHVDETSLRVERKNHSPVWWDNNPWLLGIISVIQSLRPWPLRFSSYAEVGFYY